MAARWVTLPRPRKPNTAALAAKRSLWRDCMHALGASSMLFMAAAMNFVLYPEALAQVVSGEHEIVGFVPTEPQFFAGITPVPEVELNEAEVRLLAATVWGEARSEGELGMRAVAHVMVNRVGDRFGEDLATVILTPKQFSVWNRGDPNRRLVMSLARDPEPIVGADGTWEAAQRIAREVLSGQSVDPTGGALFYHTRAVRPSWARYGEGRQTIGAHIFYADVPDRAPRRTPPRVTNVAQVFEQPIPIDAPQAQGPRAGRVNGVIQRAPAAAARQSLPSENAAATPTLNGVPMNQLRAAGAVR